MGQKVATLEIELAMATGGAVSDLTRFGGAVDKVSAQAIRDLDKIDAAIAGVGDMSQATASMVKFADETAKSAISAARELARVERAGESMAAKLDRQLSAFGKTSAEIRGMKAETAALAAEQQGMAELAGRIRSAEAELYALEYAEIRKASEAARAAGEEKAAAADKAIDKATAEATALREAAHAYQMFEAAAREGAAAMREADAAANATSIREAAQAHMMFEARVRAGAIALREEEAAASADAATIARLREMLDPAAAAQDRLNKELAEAQQVMRAAGFSGEEIARVHGLMVRSGTAVNVSTGQMKAGMQQLSYNLNDAATMFSMNARPMQIFASQAGQIVQAIQLMSGEAKGFIGFLGGPWGLGLTTAILVLAPLVMKLLETDDAAKKAEEGMKAFASRQGEIGNFIDSTTGKLVEQNQVLVRNAILTRQKAIDDNRSVIKAGQADAFTSARGVGDPLRGSLLARVQAGLGLAAGATVEMLSDAGVAQIIKQANGDVAKLDAGLQALAARRPNLRPLALEVSNLAGASVNAARDNERLGKEIEALQGKGALATKGMAGMIEKQVALATATTATERAQAAYNIVKERGALAEKLGGAALDAYQIDLTKAANALNSAEAADKAVRASRIQHNKDVRAAAKEAKDELRDYQENLRAIYEQRESLDKLLAAGSKPVDFKIDYDLDLPDLPDFVQQMRDQLASSEDDVKRYADAFGASFGSIGNSLAAATAAFVEYGTERRRINEMVAASSMTEAQGLQESTKNQIAAYANITGAAKGMFSERSRIYKALEAAETVLRAVQLAMSIRKMVQDTAETISTVANSGVRAAAAGAEGVANQSKLPFPANLAAMAATAAALVAIGVAITGGIGGGKNDLPKANDGTGTVLGDTAGKSESIQRSLDQLGDINDATLTVSRGMLTSLRSIENSIGGLSTLLVRAGNINANGGVNEGFKTDAVGSILSKIPLVGGILGGLFGSKTKVVGSGLYGGAQTLDDILGGGFDASYYSDVEKKKKLFGLTASKKYSTQLTGADGGIEDQFTLLIRQFYETIGAAAGPLGQSLESVQNKLLGFTVDIGKIDLQGLTGEEIQEKLSAVFGAAADRMAEAAVPGLSRFQKVGEGAFETLVRVSSTVEQVDATFQRLGVTTGSLGVDVDMAIAGLFDSVSDFTDAAGAYFDAYYSDAERAAAETARMAKAFSGLGLAMPDTLAGFRSLVEAQDLTTAAGHNIYATLLQIAPAFADLKGSLDGAASAAAIVRQRDDLQEQLLDLTGDTAAIRAAELAKLDPSNRALQQQIYAIKDAQDAAKVAEQLRAAWVSVGDSLMDEVKRIRGLNTAAGGGTYASLLGQFNAANAAAMRGDQDAAKSLPGLSRAALDAAAAAATSRQELDRVQGQFAAALEHTADVVASMTGRSPTDTLSAAGSPASGSPAASAEAATNDLRKELADMRADLNAALATIAGNTSRTAKTLENVTARSGGDAVSVAA